MVGQQRQIRTTSRGIAGIGRLIIGLYAAALTACAALPTDLAESGAIRVERIDSGIVKLTRVSVYSTATGLLVTGGLRRCPHVPGLIPGRLEVDVLSAEGNLLEKANVTYRRPSPKSRVARYSIGLAVPRAGVGAIRVVYLKAAGQDT